MKNLVFALVLTLLLAACSPFASSTSPSGVDEAAIEQACVDAGGVYIAEHVECELISEAACADMGGTFDECASACRHEPEDVVCTANCVPLCTFDETMP